MKYYFYQSYTQLYHYIITIYFNMLQLWKPLVVCLLLISFIGGIYKSKSSLDSGFESWKLKYGVKYEFQQNIYREQIFNNNLRIINTHNSKKNTSYKMGINQFTTLSQDEFQKIYTMSTLKPNSKIRNLDDNLRGIVIDWDSQGVVTSVKDFGVCSYSSYAFAPIGATQSLSAIFFRTYVQLSAAQIVQCSNQFGNDGCKGGRNQNTYDFITIQGVMPASIYPWNNYFTGCKYKTGTFTKITGYKTLFGCNELLLQLQVQPVSVYVDGKLFNFYESGIFGDCTTELNAALLLIGATDTYWKLRNSWGINWGQSGNIRLARGNSCGVCLQPTAPIPKL